MTQPATVKRWTRDGAVAEARQRPDGAWSAHLPQYRPDAWGALVEQAVHDGCGTLLVSLPVELPPGHVGALRAAGFEAGRTETRWRIPLTGHPTPAVRTVHELLPVTDLDPDLVAVLDNAVRADIPGTERWVGSGAQLLQTLDDPEFDPGLYRVARHPGTGSLDGLIRVWNRHPEPRLGCLGVTRPWRRTRLALALVQDVATTLRSRGVTHLTTETDDTNRDSSAIRATSAAVCWAA